MGNPYSVQPMDITPGVQSLVGSIKTSRAESQMEKLREKAADIYENGDPDEISRFMISNPEFQQVFQGQMDMKQQQRTQMFTDTAKSVLAGGQPNFESLVGTAEQMIEAGEDASDVLDLIDQYSQSPEVATKTAEKVMALYDPEGFQSFKKSQGSGKVSSPATDIDDYVADAEAQYLLDNPDKKEMPPGKRNEARRNFKRAQAAERREIVRTEKTVAGEEARASDLITRGIASAESTATIRRAIDLLDTVETGGIDNANLAAKRFFGVEGADEGELSGALGKAVLSQLRETFGAAFTQEEGNRLIRIEAGFGKSPETNKRLLNQSLRIANRTAERALKSAETRGDQATIDDITELLNFSLSGEPAAQYKEGQTATGANGEKLIFKNGNWGPM